MIVEKEFRKLVHQLVKQEVAKISLGNSEIVVHVLDNATKLAFSSLVYAGGNFIPLSVRKCLTHEGLILNPHIKTSLNLHEETCSITLSFLGGLQHLNKRMFVDLLEEFSSIADEWRLYLDEHDKNDLVHVHSPRK